MDKPIFYDESGKRKLFVNFLLSIFVSFLVFLTAFTAYHIITLYAATNGDKTQSLALNQDPRGALLYTSTSASSYNVLADQMSTLDTLIVPKYHVTPARIDTPSSYEPALENVDTLSDAMSTQYDLYYTVGAHDYYASGVQTGRTPSTENIDSIIKRLTQKRLEIVASDAAATAADGILLDFDISDFSVNQLNAYKGLVSRAHLAANNADIKLGIKFYTTDLTNTSLELTTETDLVYLDYDYDVPMTEQVDASFTAFRTYGGTIVYEAPTLSTTTVEGQPNVPVPYSEIDEGLVGTRYDRALNVPLTIAVESEPVSLQNQDVTVVRDAVTSYNYAHAIAENTQRLFGEQQLAVSHPGFEEYSIWSVMPAIDDRSVRAPEPTKSVLQATYTGTGEITRLVSEGSQGKRTYTYDAEGYVTDSTQEYLDTLPEIRRSGQSGKKVAITFDDGPHPVYTRQVLDILDEYGAKGTFFLLGEKVEQFPEITKEIVARGHQVENHTYTHPYVTQLTDDSVYTQIESTTEIIERVTGQKVRYYRQPFGASYPAATERGITLLSQLNSLGLKSSEYDIDSKDWQLASAQDVIDKVKNDLAASPEDGRTQLLFHDASSKTPENTLKALPVILDFLQKQNYEIVAVSSLDKIEDKGATDPSAFSALFVKNAFLRAMVIVGLIVLSTSLATIGWTLIGTWLYNHRKLVNKYSIRHIPKHIEQNPKLSVIIACYNEESVIGKTIEALLMSTYKNFELIIVNDGSKDSTAEVISDYVKKYPKITFLDRPNGGKAKALEAALEYNTNEWVVFCDADTIFDEFALERFKDEAVSTPELGASAGRVVVGNAHSFLTRSQALEYGVAHMFLKAAQHATTSVSVVPGATGIWSMTALSKSGGYTQDTLAEDTDATYRLHQNNYGVTYRHDVLSWTEAPSTYNMLIKQRIRWQLGNLQVISKHIRGLFNRTYGNVGIIIMPLVIIGFIQSLITPVVTLYTIYVAASYIGPWTVTLPFEYSFVSFKTMLFFGFVLLASQLIMALTVIIRKTDIGDTSRMKAVITIPYFLIVFNLILSYATIVAILKALRGTMQGWGYQQRTASVSARAPSMTTDVAAASTTDHRPPTH